VGHVEDRWYVNRDGRRVQTARHGRGKRYRVRYVVDGRERSGGSFDRKIDAERALTRVQADLLRGVHIDPTDSTTVAQAARVYAQSRPHAPSSAERIESLIRNHIEGTPLGARRLAAVRPSEAQTWVADRARVLAPSTMRILVAVVRSVYRAAVHDHIVAGNPFERISLPRADVERDDPLTVAQVLALADAIGPRYRAMVLVQAGLGLRVGELLALRVQDVDFLRRTVRVEDQINVRTGERKRPKTRKGRRTLPLPAQVAEAIAAHLSVYPPNPDGLIFHTSTGRPYGMAYGGEVFPRAVERAGLPKGTGTHALRHHFTCEMIDEGLSPIEVAELLGHEDATQVIKVYARRVQGARERSRRAMERRWNAGLGGPGEGATAQGRPQ
jgi:integrase